MIIMVVNVFSTLFSRAGPSHSVPLTGQPEIPWPCLVERTLRAGLKWRYGEKLNGPGHEKT